MLNENFKGSISVITSSFNSESTIIDLANSLRNQTDKDFEWIVCDGLSDDKTIKILKEVNDLNLTIISEKDFGIYDAINKALRICKTEYYVVAGADDIFYEGAIKKYKEKAALLNSDLIIASVQSKNRFFEIKKGPEWLFAEKSYIANHSVGTLIKKSLHNDFGFYSKKFPIAADSYFLLRACQAAVSREELDFTAGEIGLNGVSATDWAGSATELFRVQLLCGHNLFLQYFLLTLRFLRGSLSFKNSNRSYKAK
jgi:glycosyltransferase involved in cell wall biosynthesis